MGRGVWFPKFRPEDVVSAPLRSGPVWQRYVDVTAGYVSESLTNFRNEADEVHADSGSWHIAEEKATRTVNRDLERRCRKLALDLGLTTA